MFDQTEFSKDITLVLIFALCLTLISNVLLIGGLFYTDSLPDFTGESTNPIEMEENELNSSISDVRNNTVTIYNTDSIQNSQGSGFVTKDNYIITNAHVAGSNDTVYLQFSDEQVVEGSVIGTDRYTDLSVINPESLPSNISGLSFADSATVGESVFAIGAPSGFRSTLTTGVISGTERSTLSVVEGYSIPDMIQVDAALNPGNSGGPIVNENGEVVAVAQSKQGDNLGFGISYRLTEKITTSLIDDGNVDHPFIGIRTLEANPVIADQTDYIDPYQGILVTDVIEGGPASEELFNLYTFEEDSISQRGDMIVSIKDTRIRTNNDLSRALLLNYEGGDTVKMDVITPEGERETREFTLGVRPDPDDL